MATSYKTAHNVGLGPAFHRLAPLILVGTDCLGLTRSEAGVGSLVSALGVAHHLRRLCGLRTLHDHLKILSAEQVLSEYRAEFRRQMRLDPNDAVACWIRLMDTLEDAGWFGTATFESSQAAILDDAKPLAIEDLDRLPLPHFPVPSFWLHGRIWLLETKDSGPGFMQIRYRNDTLGLTGYYLTTITLWHDMQAHRAEFYSTLAQEHGPQLSASALRSLTDAKRTLEDRGFLQRGDFLLTSDSSGIRLGHILPPHRNLSLGIQCQGDLAVSVTYNGSFNRSNLAVLQLTNGLWSPISVPNGLCLGPDPTRTVSSADAPRGMDVAGFLRWAARRFADNGIFHERDL